MNVKHNNNRPYYNNMRNNGYIQRARIILMPINNKQQAFINEYMVNGHNATQAYVKAYPDAKTGHRASSARLLANVSVSKAIQGLMAKAGAETGWSVAQALKKLNAAYDVAETTKQSAGMVASVVAANRMFGLDKDSQANPDQPLPLTPDQHQEAIRAANVVLADTTTSQEAS
jgi:hypothetical protein